MFKLILCVVFAVAAADPQLLVSPGYSSAYLDPVTTTITRQASSVVNTPLLYSGFDHLIKKRAAPLISSYLGNYWDPTFALPYVYSNPAFVGAPHLIKKRQVALAPIGYTHPAVTYSSVPTIADGLPLAFDNLHFIKKRQAVWPAPINYVGSPLAAAVIPEAPVWSAYAGLPFIKK